MELKDYEIKSIHHVPFSPPLASREFPYTKTRYGLASTGVIIYTLPFVYNEFKMICLLTILRNEGMTFKQIESESSNCTHCYHYKAILTGHREIRRSNIGTKIEMTVLITEIEIHDIPKFRVATA